VTSPSTSTPGSTASSEESLDAIIERIEHSFGKGAVMKLGGMRDKPSIDVISTGSLGLDVALGVGGLPRGRIVEIFGPESSGKTTLALHVVAQAQAIGAFCTFIDVEHALNPQWAKDLGVNIDQLLVCQPDSGEQALEIADTLINSGKMGVIVLDSVAALVPRAELEGEMGDVHMGLQARLMSQALRKITASLQKSNTLFIFINQIRMKIGQMFGNPETTSGGRALPFYASVRLDIRRIGSIKQSERIIGNQIRVKVTKNKVAPPFRQAEFDIEFNKGISKSGEIIDLGVQAGLIRKSGTWYFVASDNKQLGQGREKAKVFLEENPATAKELAAAIKEKLLSNPPPTMDAKTDTTEDEPTPVTTEAV